MIQITGDSVLFRLAWTWLNRYHEPTLVGAAVTLFGLAFGLPTLPEPTQFAGSGPPAALSSFGLSSNTPSPNGSSPSGPSRPGVNDTVRDDAYYRQKWASDAAAFYDANPPRDFDAVVQTGPIVTASLRQAKGPANDFGGIAQASHSDSQNSAADPVFATDRASAGFLSRPDQIAPLSPDSRNWRVATFMAAGLLASLVFAAAWPVRAAQDSATAKLAFPGADRESSPPSDAVAITLPSAWVSVRPTARETVRRGIVGTSYAMAGVATWGIWF